jgi:16S rRNA processing protein RimM
VTEAQSRLICLGIISSAHGVRGQVKIRSFTSDPKAIATYGTLQDKSGKPYRLTVTGHTNNMVIASIAGIDDRNTAEKLRNIELFVERSALPKSADNEYYHEDLIGLEVIREDGSAYGKVTSISNFGAGDIVEIKLTSGKEESMPLNKATFPVIDIKNKKLVITPPEFV